MSDFYRRAGLGGVLVGGQRTIPLPADLSAKLNEIKGPVYLWETIARIGAKEVQAIARYVAALNEPDES